jgi:probable selenium-dependent hydroxylase accessory protein YqeC
MPVESMRGLLLKEAFGLKSREVISLVGGGGKTTLMFRLARELCDEGKKVITTTTTRIMEPSPQETAFLFVNTNDEEIKRFVDRNIGEYRHITLASERLGGGKLKGISPGLVEALCRSEVFDFMIIEADGSAGLPVKAPREGEPVIPSNTTLLVALLGTDGVGLELTEGKVFRPEIVSSITGIPMGGKMTDEAMAVLISHPKGITKGTPPSSRRIVFLNKVDIPDGEVKAEKVIRKIVEKQDPRIDRIVLGQTKMNPPVVRVIFPADDRS